MTLQFIYLFMHRNYLWVFGGVQYLILVRFLHRILPLGYGCCRVSLGAARHASTLYGLCNHLLLSLSGGFFQTVM